jgi:hypothetical protein
MAPALEPSALMKVSQNSLLAATSVFALNLTACEAVKFVFKTGFWVGALVVVALVMVIGFALRRAG